MAKGSGTTARALAALASTSLLLASCAGLASWDGFSGGDAPLSRTDGGDARDTGLADGRADVEDAGAEASAIQFVQVNAVAKDPNTVTKLDVPFMQAQTAGNLNVVMVGWYDDAAVQTVTDTTGNKYVLAVGPTTIGPSNNRVVQAIYYAANIAGSAVSGNTVSVLWNKSTDDPDVRVLEYRGLRTSEPLIVAVTSSGNSLATTSGPAMVSSAPALLVAGGITGSGYSTAGPGFTVRTITEGASLAADSIVAEAGTYASASNVQSSDFWVMQLAAFR